MNNAKRFVGLDAPTAGVPRSTVSSQLRRPPRRTALWRRRSTALV